MQRSKLQAMIGVIEILFKAGTPKAKSIADSMIKTMSEPELATLIYYLDHGSFIGLPEPEVEGDMLNIL